MFASLKELIEGSGLCRTRIWPQSCCGEPSRAFILSLLSDCGLVQEASPPCRLPSPAANIKSKGTRGLCKHFLLLQPALGGPAVSFQPRTLSPHVDLLSQSQLCPLPTNPTWSLLSSAGSGRSPVGFFSPQDDFQASRHAETHKQAV